MLRKLFIIFVLIFGLTYAESSYSNIDVVNNFQANLYLGKWYETARLPLYFERDCRAPITAEYSMEDENIGVKNSCYHLDGKLDIAFGMAYFTESNSVAKLKVTFLPKWLRFTHIGRADYWVLDTDYTSYALVGSPNHDYLWILSRTENLDNKILQELIKKANDYGYDTSKLIFNYTNSLNTQSLK